MLYLHVTVGAREFFEPLLPEGQERNANRLLHGINELHHTIANQLLRYCSGIEDFPAHAFVEQLFAIAEEYGLKQLLAQSVDLVCSHEQSRK